MKVKLRENMRSSDFEGFNISLEEVKELQIKDLKSYDVRNALFKGLLIPVEGEIVTNLKHAKIVISAEHFPLAYVKEFDKYFVKDLEMDTISFKEYDEIPKNIYEILNDMEVTEDPVEEEVTEEVTEEEAEDPVEPPIEEEVTEDPVEPPIEGAPQGEEEKTEEEEPQGEAEKTE